MRRPQGLQWLLLIVATVWLMGGLNPLRAAPGKNQIGEEIRVGFWNLRSLKNTGHERADFKAMAQVIHGMDCIALGETHDNVVLSKLVNELSILGGKWNKVKNRRGVGFTHSTGERYGILYRSDRIEVLRNPETLAPAEAVVEGSSGRQRIEHRPLHCTFATLDKRLDFTVMVLNVTQRRVSSTAKPTPLPLRPYSYKDAEIQGLKRVFLQLQDRDPSDNDLILLGNMQRDVGTAAFAELLSIPGMVDLADPARPTTLGRANSFDHIFFQTQELKEYQGQSGVDRFEDTWFSGDAAAAARACSDHRPIWLVLKVPQSDDD